MGQRQNFLNVQDSLDGGGMSAMEDHHVIPLCIAVCARQGLHGSLKHTCRVSQAHVHVHFMGIFMH